MSFTRWLQKLRSALAPAWDGRNHRRSRRVAAHPLRLEVLEDRRTPSFSPAASYPAGTNPQTVVTADFNGDGKPDLATVNYSSSTVSVLLGSGDGTFAAALTSFTGDLPVSVAVGDFDADGNLDLVTASGYDMSVSVLPGNGDGTFQAPTRIGLDSSPTSVAVGDFNGDGRLDLGVTSNSYVIEGYAGCLSHYEGRVSVLLGNGDDTFALTDTQSLDGAIQQSASVAVGDFNMDGNLDLVVPATVFYPGYGNGYGSVSGRVSVLLGNGDGTLQAATDTNVGSSPTSVSAGDVNGDGNLDLVTANGSGNDVSVLLGDGLGAFGTLQSFGTGSYYAAAVVLGDFTGDGKIDVATTNYYSDDLSVLCGLGDGSFTAPLHSAVGTSPVGVVAGDFNGDGWLDVVTADSNSDTVSVLINDHAWPPADAPSISINDVTVTEGNTDTVSATFTVSLSAAYVQPVTVHYATADGSATAGSDYTAASGDVTFAAGETSRTITVLVNGERLYEPDETFFIKLTSPTNAFVADSWGAGIIQNDDLPPPTVVISDASVTEGNTGTVSATFTVSLSAAYVQPVTVHFATADGSAKAGSDYQTASGTLTFAPGEIGKTVTVLVTGDRLGESNEYFLVNLSTPTNATIIDDQAVGTILDDEPRISISDSTVTEGNTGTVNATFIVSLSVAYDVPVTVHYQTGNYNATAGSDYTAASGEVTFGIGETSRTITIVVLGDRLGEPTETFYVALSTPTNAYITDYLGIGTILDNEPQISINSVSLSEGNSGTKVMRFTLTLSAAYDQAVTVNFATHDDTAKTSDNDYVATSGTLTFAPGVTTRTIDVVIKGDKKKEHDESFYILLSGASSNVFIANTRGWGIILGDDGPPPSVDGFYF